MPPSVRVVSASESAARDRAAIERGTPSRVLMQRAGNASADEIARRYAARLKSGALIFTGSGNNGGDGWVVAAGLAKSGVDVTVVEAVEARSPEAVAERTAALGSIGKVVSDNSVDSLGSPGVVVDALLGTGASGEPRGEIASAI